MAPLLLGYVEDPVSVWGVHDSTRRSTIVLFSWLSYESRLLLTGPATLRKGSDISEPWVPLLQFSAVAELKTEHLLEAAASSED